ncbi:MAG: acyltransferase [Segetibacter sp.]|nr:acyltransferase [Segetibacter sp.]
MAFELEPDARGTRWILSALHFTTIAGGLLAIWFGADAVVKYFMQKRWFLWAASFAFIIYALHVPLIHYATRLVFMYLHNFRYYRLLTWQCL